MRTIITVNGQGALELPAELRRTAGLKTGDRLVAEITPRDLLLRLAAAPRI